MSNLPIEIIRHIFSYISPNIDLRRAIGLYERVKTGPFGNAYMEVERSFYTQTVVGTQHYMDLLARRPRVLPIQYYVHRNIRNTWDFTFRGDIPQDCVVADIIMDHKRVYYDVGIFVLRLGQPPENHNDIFPIGDLKNVYWSAVFYEYTRT
jgi:hypothetical protein